MGDSYSLGVDKKRPLFVYIMEDIYGETDSPTKEVGKLKLLKSMLNAFKPNEQKDAEKMLGITQTQYLAKGCVDGTSIDFLQFNYDGKGSAIIAETKHTNGGVFSKGSYSRIVKVISAEEVKAIVESSDYIVA